MDFDFKGVLRRARLIEDSSEEAGEGVSSSKSPDDLIREIEGMSGLSKGPATIPLPAHLGSPNKVAELDDKTVREIVSKVSPHPAYKQFMEILGRLLRSPANETLSLPQVAGMVVSSLEAVTTVTSAEILQGFEIQLTGVQQAAAELNTSVVKEADTKLGVSRTERSEVAVTIERLRSELANAEASLGDLDASIMTQERLKANATEKIAVALKAIVSELSGHIDTLRGLTAKKG